mmetsp:Transcript_31548/g.39252  ORF Transcript_31548/g.39252 Transcript_31548/m.39252 type:complete len:86 (+) Transcript_31548:118-375(+)
MDFACTCLEEYLGTFYADVNLDDKVYVQVLMVISIICEGFNYLFLKMFKGLKQHPMRLYRWLSLANFFVFWTSLFTPLICKMKLS